MSTHSSGYYSIDVPQGELPQGNGVTNHLISLIDDVLDMAKIEDGSLTLAHEPGVPGKDPRPAYAGDTDAGSVYQGTGWA